MLTKLLTGFDLLTKHVGLCHRHRTRPTLAADRTNDAGVGPVACLRVVGTGAPWLVALEVAHRKRTAPHGLGLGEVNGQLVNDLGSVGSVWHGISFRVLYSKAF